MAQFAVARGFDLGFNLEDGGATPLIPDNGDDLSFLFDTGRVVFYEFFPPVEFGDLLVDELGITYDDRGREVITETIIFWSGRLAALTMTELDLPLDPGDIDIGLRWRDVTGGDDLFDGGVIGDVIFSGSGADLVFGRQGDDVLRGEAGPDDLAGGANNDVLFGGGGRDRLFGDNGADTLLGGRGTDRLFGNRGADEIDGGAGGDRLVGGGGTDTLVGGRGADDLSGGGGADLFLFLAASDVGGPGRADVIRDLTAVDVIDLEEVDANDLDAGDQEFAFIGALDFTGEAGDLRFTGDELQGDRDGDGTADFVIQVFGATAAIETLLVL